MFPFHILHILTETFPEAEQILSEAHIVGPFADCPLLNSAEGLASQNKRPPAL